MFLSISKLFIIVILQLGFYINSNFTNFSISENCKEISKALSVSSEIPVVSPQNIIFEVKHCKSPNVVVYQANKTLPNVLDAENPIDVYWLMITKGKKVETLTSIEWRMAFGYKLKQIIRGKKYSITLNAIKEKVITITQNENGKVDAFMVINGVYAKLSSVYIDFEYSFYLPKVNYVEFIGLAVNSNKKCTQKIFSKE